MPRFIAPTLLLLALPLSADLAFGQIAVMSAEPTPRIVTAPVDTAITVRFDRAVNPATITNTSFWAFGRWSGAVPGTFAFTNGNATVSLTPTRPFSAGESVLVVLSNTIRGMDGTSLRAAGYAFTFWTRPQRTGLDFQEIQRFSTRTIASETSRAYGGFASDLDEDGHLDITIINEDTSDLRVFLNRADDSGTFAPFLMPTVPTGSVPSPSEPADFDRDGHVDVAVADIGSNSVSILLGNGDGTFAPRQAIALGGSPRGIAVLDVDGDGDIDVAVTESTNNSQVTVVRNDGNGVFGSASSFDTGSAGEWALGAADMNEDGVLDLVVGARTSARIHVYLNNADGSGAFTAAADVASGGGTWMLALGDVNGDGHDDLVTANSSSNNGGVLLGDGAGNLGAVQTHATDPFPLATDLGDLDGDGDLDWVTASFLGDWTLFRNLGNGAFAFDRTFDAPQAASCSLAMDIDNDGDLDLALIDELEDVVIIHANQGALFADDFEVGDTSAWTVTVP